MQTIFPPPLRNRPNAGSENLLDQLDLNKTTGGRTAPRLTSNLIAMIIVTRPDATEAQIEHIVSRIHGWGLRAEVSRGEMRVVIGVIGPEDKIREKPLGAFPGVESVTPVLKPYKLVSYEFRGMPSKIKIGNVVVGGKQVVLMAGPCSVENEDQIIAIAQAIGKAGAKILRGGAFKPRTSPYSFQGLGKAGL